MPTIGELISDKTVREELLKAKRDFFASIRVAAAMLDEVKVHAPELIAYDAKRQADENLRLTQLKSPNMCRVAEYYYQQAYLDVLRESLFDRLPRPKPLLFEELRRLFCDTVLWSRPDSGSDCWHELESAFHRLADTVLVSDPFPIWSGPYSVPEPLTIWSDKFRFTLNLAGVLPVGGGREFSGEIDEGRPQSIYGNITAVCTKAALDEFVVECQSVLQAAFRTYESSVRLQAVPRTEITAGKLRGELHLLTASIDAYFVNADKKDTMDRRIRNAVHLLVESDRQTHSAVALTLSVAAIESLVGRKDGELANLIADSVAVLLEPDLNMRALAVSYSKKLYDARSRAVHGDNIDAPQQLRRSARSIAAAALKAMIEWRDTLRRSSTEVPKPDVFFQEIKRLRFQPGQPVGVMPTEVCELWRTDNGAR